MTGISAGVGGHYGRPARGTHQGSYVPSKGGIEPRSRNNDGSWRKKRSDAGKSRTKGGAKKK